MNAGDREPARLLAGKIERTIVAGRVVQPAPSAEAGAAAIESR